MNMEPTEMATIFVLNVIRTFLFGAPALGRLSPGSIFTINPPLTIDLNHTQPTYREQMVSA
jgi:hypothetical protein